VPDLPDPCLTAVLISEFDIAPASDVVNLKDFSAAVIVT